MHGKVISNLMEFIHRLKPFQTSPQEEVWRIGSGLSPEVLFHSRTNAAGGSPPHSSNKPSGGFRSCVGSPAVFSHQLLWTFIGLYMNRLAKVCRKSRGPHYDMCVYTYSRGGSPEFCTRLKAGSNILFNAFLNSITQNPWNAAAKKTTNIIRFQISVSENIFFTSRFCCEQHFTCLGPKRPQHMSGYKHWDSDLPQSWKMYNIFKMTRCLNQFSSFLCLFPFSEVGVNNVPMYIFIYTHSMTTCCRGTEAPHLDHVRITPSAEDDCAMWRRDSCGSNSRLRVPGNGSHCWK